jgi:hypothetical protein
MILYILRPVIPFIEYTVNKDYIIKNLCINRDKPKSCCEGKCHLNKELAKSDTSSETTNDTTPKPRHKQFNEFLEIQIFSYQAFETNYFQHYYSQLGKENRIASAVFVPPKHNSQSYLINI